jgi:hypothetical protein
MIKLKDLILEKKKYTSKDLELANLDARDALEYVKSQNIPTKPGMVFTDFLKNFTIAKMKCNIGVRERYDMPVIDTKDVYQLQYKLLNGHLDINDPYSISTDPKNPFPQGLKGKDAKLFLTAGLRDNSVSDDIIKCKMAQIPAIKLKPIQRQIHFDKSIYMIKNATNIDSFIKNNILVCTSDNFILDGHHRFLTALLINPKIQLKVLKVDLSADVLVPLSLSYSDSLGHNRNV